MELIYSQGRENVAKAYVGRFDDGSHVEFVESWDPAVAPEEKWVLIISTLHGCPINCAFCDAGGSYRRKLTAVEMLTQIMHIVRTRYPDMHVPIRKFKIQFARVGEPALNPGVLEVLERLPGEIDAPGLLPCLSTVAPSGSEDFFTARMKYIVNGSSRPGSGTSIRYPASGTSGTGSVTENSH
jgi:23S rRNA (adenine2503-C2)-methyltransferase